MFGSFVTPCIISFLIYIADIHTIKIFKTFQTGASNEFGGNDKTKIPTQRIIFFLQSGTLSHKNRLNILFFSLIFLLSTTSHADLSQLRDQLFQDRNGAKQKITDHVKPNGSLVLFWANWCLPCKEELKLVAKSSSKLGNFHIVAVNVDEENDRFNAYQFLDSVSWPFAALDDPGGQFFYQARSSGTLPFSAWVDSSGEIVKVFSVIDSSTVASLEKLGERQNTSPKNQNPFQISNQSYLRQQKSSLEDQTDEALAMSTSTTFNKGQWSAGVTHSLLGQKRGLQSNGKANWEDELGKSHVQYNSESYSLRLGDKEIDSLSGQLLSVRELPDTNDSSTLLGAHGHVRGQSWDLHLNAGKIRQKLFGNEINPNQDISISLPDEQAANISASLSNPIFSQLKHRVQLGAALYEREKEPLLGYQVKHRDQRASLGFEVGPSNLKLQTLGTRYFVSEGSQEEDYENPFLIQSGLIGSWQPSQIRWGTQLFHQTYRSLPPRSRFVFLTPENAIPLDSDETTTVHLSPKVDWVKSNWSLGASYTNERSLVKNVDEEQHSYGLFTEQLDYAFATGLIIQNLRSRLLNKDNQENIFYVRGHPWKPLSLGYTLRSHDSEKLSSGANDSNGEGTSHQQLVGLELNELFGFHRWGRFLLSAMATQQEGYYLGYSGLAKENLFSSRFQWELGNLGTSMAWGQEPGGVVCANGICSRRQPLNGFALDVYFSISL